MIAVVVVATTAAQFDDHFSFLTPRFLASHTQGYVFVYI